MPGLCILNLSMAAWSLFAVMRTTVVVPFPGPTIATIHDGYAQVVAQGEEGTRGVNVRLFKTKIDAKETAELSDQQYSFPANGRLMYRWRISDRCFWGTGSGVYQYPYLNRMPVEDLYLYDVKFDVEESLRLHAIKYSPGTRGIYNEWGLSPVNDVAWASGRLSLGFPGSPVDHVDGTWFDFLPTGKENAQLLILSKNQIAVWDCQAKFVKGKWDYQWSKSEAIEATFNEPYMLYAKGSTYFFLTQSGKLYLSKKPKEGQRKTEPVWTEAQQPIVAAITDTATDKTFLFGRDKRAVVNTRDFWFELDENPKIERFDPSILKPMKAKEPLKTVWEYAQLLAERQKEKK